MRWALSAMLFFCALLSAAVTMGHVLQGEAIKAMNEGAECILCAAVALGVIALGSFLDKHDSPFDISRG